MLLLSSLIWLACLNVASAQNTHALRMIMTDSRFVGLVSPCTAGGTARTIAGEWIRTAFHDAGSYDAASGTGGIDGSIAFEMSRAENTGSFAPATIIQYRNSQETGVSLADLVVLGAITAIGACGGPVIPFRAGRKDAGGAAEEGHLPLPEESLLTHRQKFARMGFSNNEMITAVACGHTVGGVHRVNNPTITSVTNAGFDTTRQTFDNAVAVEYMNGVLTNPLGQPINGSIPEHSSDSRIFNSDGNVTMSRYAASQSVFFEECTTVFGRMFNDAIPAGTALTAPLAPYPVSLSSRVVMRDGSLALQTGSARVYDLVGQYTSYEVVYYTRSGALGTDNLLTVNSPRTINNGKPIVLRDYRTKSGGINPVTGISAVQVQLRLNDGSLYSSAEGAEIQKIDDTFLVDTGASFTCAYGTSGINITVAVLGAYNPADRVEIQYELASDITRQTYGVPLKASYRSTRADGTYHYYGVFIADKAAINFGNFAAKITRADGTIARDDRLGLWYWQVNLDACVAGAEVPAPAPVPTAGMASGSRKRNFCGQGKVLCGSKCVNVMTSLEFCGGCLGDGGMDCTLLSDDVACVRGKCVLG